MHHRTLQMGDYSQQYALIKMHIHLNSYKLHAHLTSVFKLTELVKSKGLRGANTKCRGCLSMGVGRLKKGPRHVIWSKVDLGFRYRGPITKVPL